MPPLRRLTAALLLAALAVVVPATAGSAATPAPDAMQDRVDRVISAHGGEQTSWNEVAWAGGVVVLTLAPDDASAARETAARADDCGAGRYCAYARVSYGGNKLTYSACPASYTSFGALLGPVRSIKNSLGSGTVRAYAGSSVVATLSPGSGAGSVSGVSRITCS